MGSATLDVVTAAAAVQAFASASGQAKAALSCVYAYGGTDAWHTLEDIVNHALRGLHDDSASTAGIPKSGSDGWDDGWEDEAGIDPKSEHLASQLQQVWAALARSIILQCYLRLLTESFGSLKATELQSWGMTCTALMVMHSRCHYDLQEEGAVEVKLRSPSQASRHVRGAEQLALMGMALPLAEVRDSSKEKATAIFRTLFARLSRSHPPPPEIR